MKQRVFVDTNIVLDLLLMRKSFYKSASRLFALADEQKLVICISALTFTTVHYIISKQLGSRKTQNVLSQFKTLVTLLPVDNQIIDMALANDNDIKDFEDAVQYYCALSNGIDILITRDIKDYLEANISIMTADDFIKNLYKLNNVPIWKK